MSFLCLKSPCTPDWMNFEALCCMSSPSLIPPFYSVCLITTSQHSHKRGNYTTYTWHKISASQMLISLLFKSLSKSPIFSTHQTWEHPVVITVLCLFPDPLSEISFHSLFLTWQNAIHCRGPASICVCVYTTRQK